MMKLIILQYGAPAFFALLISRFADARSIVSPRYLQDDEPTSCSPLALNIILSLDQACSVDTLKPKSGIDETLCIIDTDYSSDDDGGDGDDQSDDGFFPAVRFDDFMFTRSGPRLEYLGHTLNGWREDANRDDRNLQKTTDLVPVEVTSVQILEVDTAGDLNVIKQDNSYEDTKLNDGDDLVYSSISNLLDPDLPLTDQTDILPGGLGLVIEAKNEGGDPLRLRILMTYTNICGNDCDRSNLPIDVGDKIGWVTFGDLVPGRSVFCPALVTEPPTPAPNQSAAPIATTPKPTANWISNDIGTSTSSKSSKLIKSSGKSGKKSKSMHFEYSTKSEKTTYSPAEVIVSSTKSAKMMYGKSEKSGKSDGKSGKSDGKSGKSDAKSGKSGGKSAKLNRKWRARINKIPHGITAHNLITNAGN